MANNIRNIKAMDIEHYAKKASRIRKQAHKLGNTHIGWPPKRQELNTIEEWVRTTKKENGKRKGRRIGAKRRLERSKLFQKFRFIQQGPAQNANSYSGEYIFTTNIPPVNNNTIVSLSEEIEQFFHRLIERIKSRENLQSDDKMQIYLTDGNLNVSTAFHKTQDLTASSILEKIAQSLQSFEALDFTNVKIYVKYSRAMRGGAHFKTSISVEQFVKNKKCMVNITSSPERNDCFFQCLGLGLAQLNNEELYHKLVRSKTKQKYREEEAQRILEEVGEHKLGDMPTINDIKVYEHHYSIKINIIDYTSKEIITDHNTETDRQLFFLYIEPTEDTETPTLGHYHYINFNKVSSIWNQRNFCYQCYTAYDRVEKHKCFKKCGMCKSTECGGSSKPMSEFEVVCDKCNLSFYDDKCFETHLKKCGATIRCKECNITYKVKAKRPHICEHRYCSNCWQSVPIDTAHHCYHQPITKETLAEHHSPSEKYVFYDYESYITDGKHETAGVVAMYFDNPTPLRFETDDAFIEWVFQDKHKHYTFIAHNAGKYDSHYIKKEMITRSIKSSDVVNGNCMFSCYAKDFKIRFIDSVKFIPTSLRAFTKTFGIKEISKGYFPYKFLTKANRNYVGPMPSKQYFGFDQMKKDERADALKWYEEHKADTIDLYEMCIKYCESDVALLREGCIIFRKLFMDITNCEVDPFQFITIASVCMTIYRRFYMPEKAIGVLDNSALITTSKEEYEWIDFLRSTGVSIPQRQVKIGKYVVDGLDAMNKIVYEYNGCIWHGCGKCYDRHSKNPKNFKTMYQLYGEWIEKEKYLKSKGYAVKVIWSHEWRDLKKFDKDVRAFLDTYDNPCNPLDIRESFFGGHTEPTKMYRKCRPFEKIKYRDYTSLYPSVQYGVQRGLTDDTYNELKEIFYPIGHPIQITEGFVDFEEAVKRGESPYFGFMKCKVIPPQGLYHPVLPEKKNGKLVFDLTQKIGTWTTIELEKAVQVGYKIEKIFEVQHFDKKSSNLFKKYVEMFLKIKQQSAGWKQLGCETEEEKRAYITDYLEHQNILLNYDEIGDDYNAGLYYISKLCLNSLWGKFGQRDVFGETIDTFDTKTFDKYCHNDKYEVLNVVMQNSKVRTITFRKKKEFGSIPKKTNIAIASFTTAHARLRLYEALEVLGEDVLYMDTDSVIYVQQEKEKSKIRTGKYLGDLTDELEDGEYITEYCSTGPKSYGYKTNTGGTYTKVKGFTLNYEASQDLNFESLKDMVVRPEGRDGCIITKPLQFVIDKHHNIKTKEWKKNEGKKFKLTFDKRQIVWDDKPIDDVYEIDTKPFN